KQDPGRKARADAGIFIPRGLIVANEVKKLAEQSRRSAERITTLLADISSEVTKAVETVKSGKDALSEGVSLVNRTGESFESIVGMISDVAAQSQEVSAVVEQVTASTQEMVSSIENVAVISEKNSQNTQNVAASAEEQHASMQEIAASTGHLSQIAAQLQDVIGKFKV
ncbi:methyl-accepting chemotaxis protein, partial [Paenibacillus chartarius]